MMSDKENKKEKKKSESAKLKAKRFEKPVTTAAPELNPQIFLKKATKVKQRYFHSFEFDHQTLMMSVQLRCHLLSEEIIFHFPLISLIVFKLLTNSYK